MLALRGLLAAAAGDRAIAERILSMLAAMEQPELRRGRAVPALAAAIAAQLGESEQAVRLLRQAFAAGVTGVHADPYFEPLRGYAPFEELVRPRE